MEEVEGGAGGREGEREVGVARVQRHAALRVHVGVTS